MMQAFRAVLVLFCLLTVTTSAAAECAWVLWSGTTPRGGYQSQETCEQARKTQDALAQLLARDLPSMQGAPSSLQCVPDTAISGPPSACTWTLWKAAAVRAAMAKPFAGKLECEKARDVAAKTHRVEFSCSESTSQSDPLAKPLWILKPTRLITHSATGTFTNLYDCEVRRSGMTREERGLTFCLPDTVDPSGPKVDGR